MRENGIRAKQKKKFRATTDSNHTYPVAPNLLLRNFEADMPDRKWLADITYIPTREGWLYLAAIMDLFSRADCGLVHVKAHDQRAGAEGFGHGGGAS